VRELEFLPSWYGVARRRRIALIAQAWATACLVLVLLAWTGVARFRVLTARNDLGNLRAQMAKTQADLNKLDAMNALKRRWSEQGEVLSKLGVSVESTRLMGLIAQATPESVALIGLSLQTEEKTEAVKTVSAAKSLKDPTVNRKLRVRVQGVAPSDAEVADFMAKLAAVVFLEDVSMNYTKDSDQGGRAVREFEVTFALDLNAPQNNN
jgi:Tfp pilus assembly protein PilN